MSKSKLIEILEELVAEIVAQSGESLDRSTARALLGMAIKKLRGALLAAVPMTPAEVS